MTLVEPIELTSCELKKRMTDWCQSRADVKACEIVASESGGFHVAIIIDGDTIQMDYVDELCQLERQFAEDFKTPCYFRTFPESRKTARDGFVRPEKRQEVYRAA